jgi:hypothetical protein
MRSLLILLLVEYYYDGHIKADKIGRACSMFGGEGIYIHSHDGETWRDHLENLSIDGRIIS